MTTRRTPDNHCGIVEPASAPSSPLAVVCALIERDGRVFVAQRPPHKHLGLKWEFPGGKVDAGETPEAALLREIREELGCTVELVRALPRSVHRYSATVVIEMIPFVCRLPATSPEPVCTEHMAARWCRPDELGGLDLAAADLPVVATYRAT